jgi:hypothetical protein
MKTENKNEFADNVFRPNFNFKDYEKSAIKGFREVRAVPNAGAAQLFAVHLTTNQYKDAGILSGDILIVQRVADLWEVKGNRFCVCDTKNGRVAMFSNEITDEELFGVVVRIERDL